MNKNENIKFYQRRHVWHQDFTRKYRTVRSRIHMVIGNKKCCTSINIKDDETYEITDMPRDPEYYSNMCKLCLNSPTYKVYRKLKKI